MLGKPIDIAVEWVIYYNYALVTNRGYFTCKTVADEVERKVYDGVYGRIRYKEQMLLKYTLPNDLGEYCARF